MELQPKNIEKRIAAVIQNIKKFRELKDITREQIASDLNMSVSGYSKIERGEIELTLNRICEISEILDVELSQLLNFDVTTIFNISNSQGVQGYDKGGHYYFNTDNYRDKYIEHLEQSVEMYKEMVEVLKSKNLK
jgi:transcriptional regulator with XRE-family HTH domain